MGGTVDRVRPRQLLRRFGIDVIRYPNGTSYGVELARLLRHSDLLVDVGANRGAFGLLARKLEYTGPIISFEPGADAYGELAKTARPDENWNIRNIALGNATGAATLTVPVQSVTASILPWRGDIDARRGWQLAYPMRQEEIEIRRLDEELAEVSSARIFLKIDTQGYDLRVLEGATGILDRIEALQVELAVDPVYEGAPDLIESLTWLRAHGYLPIDFNSFTCVEEGTPEFDCLLVRNSAAT